MRQFCSWCQRNFIDLSAKRSEKKKLAYAVKKTNDQAN